MTDTNEIWIVDDDSSIRWVIEKALSGENISSSSFESADELLSAIKISAPKVIISDIRMPGMDGLTLLQELKSIAPTVPVIITTAHSDLDSAVTSYESGAFEYLPKPFDIDEVIEVATRALAHTSKQPENAKTLDTGGKEIIGNAPAMQEVFRAIGRLSQSSITVLISGQSGSGKELVARALHRHSPRASAPFVALNMAAVPKDLMESELFGQEKGSFTGASGKREGRFEQASGGTLFLDEIGDMPHDTQTRLLRVLAEGEFYRVGGASAIKTDVRVIAATHQDLRGLVAKGLFREDLYHRLNVIGINVPRLSERSEDIPLLLDHFLGKAASELGVPTKEVSGQVRDYLTALDWPGNVRQLENTCRWLTVMAAGNTILMNDLPPELSVGGESEGKGASSWEKQFSDWVRAKLLAGETNVLKHAMPQIETIMMDTALEYTAGKKAEAAELLGWGRNTLTRKLSQYSQS
jgi:two-component system nitrogen regulation response regulator GlnG